jgi:hypothetical protein
MLSIRNIFVTKQKKEEEEDGSGRGGRRRGEKKPFSGHPKLGTPGVTRFKILVLISQQHN